jgi:hypothetical protein
VIGHPQGSEEAVDDGQVAGGPAKPDEEGNGEAIRGLGVGGEGVEDGPGDAHALGDDLSAVGRSLEGLGQQAADLLLVEVGLDGGEEGHLAGVI